MTTTLKHINSFAVTLTGCSYGPYLDGRIVADVIHVYKPADVFAPLECYLEQAKRIDRGLPPPNCSKDLLMSSQQVQKYADNCSAFARAVGKVGKPGNYFSDLMAQFLRHCLEISRANGNELTYDTLEVLYQGQAEKLKSCDLVKDHEIFVAKGTIMHTARVEDYARWNYEV